MAKPRRELRSRPPSRGWSKWIKAMVPGYTPGKNLKRRRPIQVGYISSSITKVFPHLAQLCGVYEWGDKRPLRGQHTNKVVYLGNTCKPGALKGRIQSYCRNGSHKADLMNDTLFRGYELSVRFQPTRIRRKRNAERMENKLLSKYNYAWNKRNNGNRVRHILRWLNRIKAV